MFAGVVQRFVCCSLYFSTAATRVKGFVSGVWVTVALRFILPSCIIVLALRENDFLKTFSLQVKS